MPPPRRDSAVPGSGQTRQQVLELGELDLPLAFPRARPAGEDVEDQLRAIDHLPLESILELAELPRRQLVIDDHHVHITLGAGRGEARHFAGADERPRVGLGALLQHAQHDRRTGGFGETRQFLHRLLRVDPANGATDEAHQRGALGTRRLPALACCCGGTGRRRLRRGSGAQGFRCAMSQYRTIRGACRRSERADRRRQRARVAAAADGRAHEDNERPWRRRKHKTKV